MIEYWLLGAVNVLAFLLFWFDKRRAIRERRRVPERTLWLSAVAGGLVGAWLGVVLCRHKTQSGVHPATLLQGLRSA